ncbi:MAG: DUF6502 family protein [Pseudomonadota bacterium]
MERMATAWLWLTSDKIWDIFPNMNTVNILNRAIRRLLYPLVRVLLRHGMPYTVFAELARAAYVNVALREFQIPGRKQTVSRVAVLTGLTRKEVLRLVRMTEAAEAGGTARPHRVERVVSGWVRDQDFIATAGESAVLPLDGVGATFEELVRRYSGDMTPRAVLDELVRVGVVEHMDDGRVKLLRRAYIPGGDEAEKLPILGADVRDLISTIDHNLSMPPAEAWLQRAVVYDNLPEEYVRRLRLLVTQDGQDFLERWDKELARHDRDVNPSAEGSGRMRAVIGVYYLEEPHLNYSEEQES